MKGPNEQNSRYCTRCARALKACLCEYIHPVVNRAPLVILQHPSEVGHPKGTASLLAASLTEAQIWVGETFSEHSALMQLLATRPCYLLWPDEQARPLAEVRALSPGSAQGEPCFLLLDGTWRKAYKMLCLNPALAALPRIALATAQGQYLIRKKPFATALSTLEAGYHLLSQWEGDPAKYAPLPSLFHRLNEQWLSYSTRKPAALRP
ncbi:DTW domain-containing protein YfiP [Aeromonas sp. BIGb0405]|uniref:tRNA-uridine aminocarboxypropyltransferase n=1 Tax=Aeromonas sp. BIGb0405 TaxID=2940592 RepID=UPI002169F193|nr:tRNA-uridine aminocarboxypropyltransferase [Aeromonas sp. BIGb0405]MCS3454134.1 DTW domain-containing protein YfiP [Aeromonas sp. BIGb0405]